MLNTRRLSGFVEWMRKGLSAKCLGGGVERGGGRGKGLSFVSFFLGCLMFYKVK